MKKILTIILSVVLVFSFSACGNSSPESISEPASSESPAEGSSAAVTEEPEDLTPESEESKDGKILVVYYSATGNTADAANYIASATGGDMFEIVPVDDYTEQDLSYNDDNSRVAYEHEHPEDRNIELVKSAVEKWEEYDTVFVGYPIWWGSAAWPIDTFIQANDFTGKTVIPFCTSASSGIGDSGRQLEEMAGTGEWLEGQRFSSGVSENDVQSWIDGLGL